MKVLLAEDEAVSRKVLEGLLRRWGYETVVCEDGASAHGCFEADTEIALCVLDWMMPGLSGVDVCRRIRETQGERSAYLVLVTGRQDASDVVEGLEAGANDFLGKPIRAGELRARIAAGARTIALERALRDRIRELDDALAHVRTLQGLLPICMHCKRVRDETSVWHRIENYLERHSEISFSHGLCEHCLKERYPEVPEVSK